MLTGLSESNYLCFEMWRWVSVFFPTTVLFWKPSCWSSSLRCRQKKMLSLPVGNGLYQPFLVYLRRMVCCWVYHMLLNIPSLWLVGVVSPCLVLQVPFWLVFPLDIWHPYWNVQISQKKYPRDHHLTSISQPFSQDLLTFFSHRSPDRSAGHATAIPGGERLQGSCCGSLESIEKEQANDRQIT